MFAVGEDGALERAEDWAPPPPREAAAAAAWAHRYPHLKEQGRCSVHRRAVPDGEDEETFEWTPEEREEGPEPLAPADGDAEVGGGPAWTPLLSSAAEHAAPHAVAGLRSNLWPGAVCAAQGARFTNAYVGWGVKAAPFVPLPPPPVAQEYDLALAESRELPQRPRAGGGGDGGAAAGDGADAGEGGEAAE